jgi:hypothetical protein
MSRTRAKWGAGVNFLGGIIAGIIPISDHWKFVICGAAALGLVLCIIGYFISPKETPHESAPAGPTVSARDVTSSNIATAARDVNIYHPPLVPPDVRQGLPDFFYEGAGSLVAVKAIIPPGKNYSVAQIHFNLHFTNGGQATAHNLSEQTYGCWIHDEPPVGILMDAATSVGRTPPGQGKNIELFSQREWDSRTGTHMLSIRKNHLTILVEISFRVGSADGPIHKNEPIWLTWTPETRDRMTEATEADVSIAKPLIDKLKNTNPAGVTNSAKSGIHERAAALIQAVDRRMQRINQLLDKDGPVLDMIAKYAEGYREQAAGEFNFAQLFEVEEEKIQEARAIDLESNWNSFGVLCQSLLTLNTKIRNYNENKVAALKEEVLKWSFQAVPKNLQDAKEELSKRPL